MSVQYDIAQNIVHNKKYECINEYCVCEHGNHNKQIKASVYSGKNVRMIVDNKTIHLVIPEDISVVQENAITSMIATGTIFDDAEEINNTNKFIQLKTIPINAMINKGIEPPKAIGMVSSGILGEMNDKGEFDISDVKIDNASNFVSDTCSSYDCKDKRERTHELVDNYLGKDDYESMDMDLKKDINNIEDELDSLGDVSNEDIVTDDDYEELDLDDGDDEKDTDDNDDGNDEEVIEEGFLSKKPKKLKPIPRDTIAYITVEMNAIKDSNDQAMLSGYTCAKIELVDFYLNVIDTKDDRYIVPHTRDYLVTMQKELNNLLTQILRIKPINRNDRVWRVNVNYPDGYQG